MRADLVETRTRPLPFDIKIFLGVPQDSSHLTLAALLRMLLRCDALPIGDLGIGTRVEEDGDDLLIPLRSVAENHRLQ